MKQYVIAILLLVGGTLVVFGDKLPSLSKWLPNIPIIAEERPINAPGFRVMIVYDDTKLATLPESQKAAIFSTDVRAFLYANAEKVDGKSDFRIVNQLTDMSKDAPYWQEAFAKERKTPTWIAVNGKTSGGFVGEVPSTVQSMMDLLKKYAEVK